MNLLLGWRMSPATGVLSSSSRRTLESSITASCQSSNLSRSRDNLSTPTAERAVI